MWPSMCMCCRLFAPTQFHFECCGVFDDSRIYIFICRKCSKKHENLWKVVEIVRYNWVLVAKDKSNHPVAGSLLSELEMNNFIR